MRKQANGPGSNASQVGKRQPWVAGDVVGDLLVMQRLSDQLVDGQPVPRYRVRKNGGRWEDTPASKDNPKGSVFWTMTQAQLEGALAIHRAGR